MNPTVFDGADSVAITAIATIKTNAVAKNNLFIFFPPEVGIVKKQKLSQGLMNSAITSFLIKCGVGCPHLTPFEFFLPA
jgi:hypothetical protein